MKNLLFRFKFLILILSLPILVYLVFQKTSFFSSASPEETPQDIRITNISDNSATVSWFTPDKATIGFIEYGETNSFGDVGNDDRDKETQTPRLTHHITLNNLKSETQYYFKVHSGSSDYNNEENPYSLTTVPIVETTPPVPNTAFGRVVFPKELLPDDMLVYATTFKGSPLSGLVKNDGSWLLTLNNARDTSLKEYVQYSSKDNIEIYVTNGLAQEKLSVSVTNKSPVPTITLKTINPEEKGISNDTENFSFSAQKLAAPHKIDLLPSRSIILTVGLAALILGFMLVLYKTSKPL